MRASMARQRFDLKILAVPHGRLVAASGAVAGAPGVSHADW
jgi:hypothetical protein